MPTFTARVNTMCDGHLARPTGGAAKKLTLSCASVMEAVVVGASPTLPLLDPRPH